MDVKGGRFLHIIQTGKMLTPVDCGKLCVCNLIPRSTTKKATQRDTLKNTSNKSNGNLKMVK